MVAGEPGYFYVTFSNNSTHHQCAQRIDVQGNIYWPAPGNRRGIELENTSFFVPRIHSCAYHFPYFFVFFKVKPADHDEQLYMQKVDSLGQLPWGPNGTLVTFYLHAGFNGAGGASNVWHLPCVPDDQGGAAAVWDLRPSWSNPGDVWAKHVNADGTLGGPLSLEVILTPENPPIQIPPGGGSFT